MPGDELELSLLVRNTGDAPATGTVVTDTLDPRYARPNINPSSEGEAYDVAGKLTAPLGGGHTLRLFGLASAEQRRLFDPVLKYDARWTPGRRMSGGLASAHWQYASTSRAARSFVTDVRLAYFTRDFVRGALRTGLDPMMAVLAIGGIAR